MPDFNKKDDARTCFSTDAGKRYLACMLTDAGFFEQLITPEDQAKENMMKVVLSDIGIWPVEDEKNFKERVDEFITNLLNMRTE